MKKIFTCKRFLLPILITGLLISMAVANDTVTVTGLAPASSGSARKQALNDAFRAAVEQSVGINVSSESIVKNAELLKDEIYSHSEGFIEKWEILSENVVQDMLELKVQAWVKEGRLNKSLFLNGLDVNKIYSWVGEPRVLILVQEFIDGQPSQMNYAQTELENIFIEKGIHVFHEQQLENIKQRDRELAFKDPAKAVTLGKRLGAEIVVSGKCISNFSRELQIGPYKQNFYSTITTVRAYSTSTGQLLLSENYTGDKEIDTSAMGKFDASVNSIKNTVVSAKSDILFKIVRNWYDGFSKPQTYQIIISNVDYDQLEKFKSKLYGFNGFIKAIDRSFDNNVAELDITYEGVQDKLIEDVIKSGLPYKITGKSQNRIQMERK